VQPLTTGFGFCLPEEFASIGTATDTFTESSQRAQKVVGLDNPVPTATAMLRGRYLCEYWSTLRR
jgi:hypothetical protein